jgi:hypothetical protein
MKTFPPKTTTEKPVCSYDFGTVLSGPITGASVEVSVISGVDASPASMLSGAANFSEDPIVKQLIIGGVNGVLYQLKFIALCNTARYEGFVSLLVDDSPSLV